MIIYLERKMKVRIRKLPLSAVLNQGLVLLVTKRRNRREEAYPIAMNPYLKAIPPICES
jgi:hypothetical protein